ncbi:PPR4 [Symbiodinium natans]|uniref:PPR4 protein n=1 Tax=Symbiodinium natans TaxID=878477 RepID=A0A812MAJ2_9DINO|nr:PPR4 [Symbiodinium natans]
MKMRRKGSGALSWSKLVVAGQALALLFAACPQDFAAGKQSSLKLLREREGLALKAKAEILPLSDDSQLLLARIVDAGERGDWQRIQQMFSAYHQSEIQIHTAVMHAAIMCGQYSRGAKVYESLCALNVTKTAPAYTQALKIYAHLGLRDVVDRVWAEAQACCELDQPLAAARIDAAASVGDVQTAAFVLDRMNRSGVSVNIAHVTSAIRACWETEGHGHNAARFLYQLLLDLGLKPNVVTFTCLIGAYKTAPLEDILAAIADMQAMDIAANTAFVETFLITVLRKPRDGRWSVADIIAMVPTWPSGRVAAAKSALEDFKREHIQLSQLSRKIDLALQQVDTGDDV